MSDAVERAVQDAKTYAKSFAISFSDEGLDVLREAEQIAYELNTYVYPWTYMTVVLSRVRSVRASLARHGLKPDSAAAHFDNYTRDVGEHEKTRTSYDIDADSYSSAYGGKRHLTTRAQVVDFAIAIAQREGSQISGLTIFEALLAHHEEHYPFISNGDWSDERLHTPHSTLSHVLGHYEHDLSVKLSDLRNDLGLPIPDTSFEHPAELVPLSVRSSVLAFLVDHPNYERNCFLIMPFRDTRLHNEIAETLRTVMRSHGFNLVRADDHVYAEDVLTNIQAYIHGCRFAIAVFERILTNDFNPNVSLEVGYFMGLRKPVCLLKEQTLPRLPSDLVGRLYVEFDGQNVATSLPTTVNRWLSARGLIQAGRS